MSTWTIVVAAGVGTRFADRSGGDEPKQYRPLAGLRVLDHSLVPAHAVSDGVVLVVAPDRMADEARVAGEVAPGTVVVAGAATRSGSVRCGLDVVPVDAEVVVVHDAARPLATVDLFRSVIGAVTGVGADGAVPGVEVTDTIKQVAGEVVVGTLDRASLVAVQTPQAFRAVALRAAHAAGPEGTDDASLVEADGGRVVVVPGDPDNRKITVAEDLDAAERVLARRRSTGDD
jgi:2-C-methyl-D-erythritol 4-phosphate cytidylyltransferase